VKRNIISTLVWISFLVVLSFSTFVFFQYYNLKKEQLSFNNSVKQESLASKIQILNDELPTTFIEGKVYSYRLVENILRGTNDLHIILSIDDLFLPVKVDHIIINPNLSKVYLDVINLNEKSRKQAKQILDNAQNNIQNVDSSYIILYSTGSEYQKKSCEQTHEDTKKWCIFDSDEQSYSAQDLYMEVEKYLINEIKDDIYDSDPSKFLYLEGNFWTVLQVNYKLKETGVSE